MPGRMLVQGLSNTKDNGGVTGFAVYSNRGELVNVQAMPTDKGGDGYGYDLAINPQKNVMLTRASPGAPTTCASSASSWPTPRP